eukprot:TRINITY_DN4858_c0_g1_i1.p1 TRINITY_DN4858_c0_g1~~TRINITY_DN4858_c0_g1_i1.p1  ORF type:complete len:507 (-),score=122.95 TRINITY_DN4858_c0_g1_i1:479-1999(-)
MLEDEQYTTPRLYAVPSASSRRTTLTESYYASEEVRDQEDHMSAIRGSRSAINPLIDTPDLGSPPKAAAAPAKRSIYLTSEDWWSFYLGLFYVFVFLFVIKVGYENPDTLVPEKWTSNPFDAMTGDFLLTMPIMYIAMIIPLMFSAYVQHRNLTPDLMSFTFAFGVTFLCNWLGAQKQLSDNGFGASIWCFAAGLFITNIIGAREWMTAGSRAEYFIKIGLVLLVVEFQIIIKLGAPTLFVTWLVVPFVFGFMWYLGNNFFKIESLTLVCLVSAATSICGSSAAAAAAAACNAPNEELTLAIGLTTVFTIIFMIGDPYIAIALGLDDKVAGAWIGGSVDSTGPVVVSAAIVSEDAEDIGSIVKMTQNIIIGPVAAAIAYYWVNHLGSEKKGGSTLGVLWERFPKFVMGFLINSLIVSFIFKPLFGQDDIDDIISIAGKFGKWWETIAFVCIGLETDFSKLRKKLVGGKPVMLYFAGQIFDTIITLGAAYIAFGGSFGNIDLDDDEE